MTFDAHEQSVHGGGPVELYEFSYLPLSWFYTSADEPVTLGAQTYSAAKLQRDPLDETAELNRQTLRLTVARDLPIAELFLLGTPARAIQLTAKRLHRDDIDAETRIFWVGRIMDCEWSELTATLVGEPLSTAIRRPALRRHYQRNCPHVLYRVRCGAQESTYRLTTVISLVSGVTLTAAAFAAQVDGWYAGGFVEWDDPDGIVHRRYIVDHTGANVTLAQPIPGLAAGATVRAWPGCDHTLATCNAKFNNAANFGGFPWIPTSKNPMGGSSLW